MSLYVPSRRFADAAIRLESETSLGFNSDIADPTVMISRGRRTPLSFKRLLRPQRCVTIETTPRHPTPLAGIRALGLVRTVLRRALVRPSAPQIANQIKDVETIASGGVIVRNGGW
jgi:hypothetical protein